MTATTVVMSALAACCIALAMWTPHSVSRLRGQTLQLFAKKDAVSDKEHVRRIIQEIRAGQLPSTVLSNVGSELPIHINRLLHVCADSGAQAVPALELLDRSLVARERLHRQVAAEISAPKATAFLLAALPIGAWWLGSALGASPVHWLLSTRWGLLALTLGCVLECVGVLLIVVMARRVQDMA